MNLSKYFNKPMYSVDEEDVLFSITPPATVLNSDKVEVRLLENNMVVQVIEADLAKFIIANGTWKLLDNAEYKQAIEDMKVMINSWKHIVENSPIFDNYPEIRALLHEFDISPLVEAQVKLEEVIE